MTQIDTFDQASEKYAALDLKSVALLLDVDGTLIDIGPSPYEVHVPKNLCHSLERLVERTAGALAPISGRPIAGLDRLFAPLKLSAVGGHGAEMRGYSGMLPMARHAMPYLWMGQFNALDPDLDLLARPGERVAAWWFWGIATVDHDAARQMIHGLLAVRPFTNGLPTFAKSATPAGRKIAAERMNFHPMRFPDDELMWAPPWPIEPALDEAGLGHAA